MGDGVHIEAMKMRYCVIGVVLLLLAGFWGGVSYLRDESYTKLNMEEINDHYANALTALKVDGADTAEPQLEEIERDYSCEIIMRDDEQYATVVNNAIADQKIVMDYMEADELAGKIIFAGQEENLQRLYKAIGKHLLYLFLAIGAVLMALFGWIYWEYIRPFRTLETFAAQISKGNLDFPLKMQRHNYFGAFTESFDIMREELKKARQGEYEANQSKKELVASLSHDIKTPVSTIKAICEILELKTKDELVLEKVLIINQKADVINSLISNMFHATLEELQLLKMNPVETLSTEIPKMLEDINYEGKIQFTNSIPECMVMADPLRLTQVIDNVVNNSYKYAGTDIEVSFMDMGDSIALTIRDFGKGVPSEELPLLTEKFYRGSNVSGKDGSGLGLYLSNQFMEGMKGEFRCENVDTPSGFLVTLTLMRV